MASILIIHISPSLCANVYFLMFFHILLSKGKNQGGVSFPRNFAIY